VVGSLLLTFVARPVTVWVSAVVQPLAWRELAFVSWAGLRGAVPIVLATIPFAAGVHDAERLFDIVFVIVVISTVLTAPTLPWVSRRLGVTRRLEPRSLDLEVAPLERVAADMLQVTVSPVSRLHGVQVGELRLPEGSSVSLVVRDGQAIVPERRTVLRRGDDLLVVTPRGLREPTVVRLRTVSAHGRLGRWLDE
jgi:cell volume regulation protein A